MPKPWFAIHKHVSTCRDNIGCAAGFTLIEVLISVIILAIGLLGLASLQALALKNNKDAFLYTQASLLGYEMSDRIKSNKAYWSNACLDGINNTGIPCFFVLNPNSENGCNDPNQACTSAQMANYDYFYWINSVQSKLPNVSVTQIKWSDTINNAPCVNAKPAICLTITWRRTDQSNSRGLNTVESTYRMEVTP